MQSDRFELPITVRDDRAGSVVVLNSAREAYNFLLNNWTGKRSAKHRTAVQACSDAMDSQKPTVSARRALVAAAREANVYVTDAA